MGVFPALGALQKYTVDLMKSRANNNIDTSKLLAWIRISSAGTVGKHPAIQKTNVTGTLLNGENTVAEGKGLILESLPENNSFTTAYGGNSRSGRVGTDFKGNSVYTDSPDRAHRPSPTIDSLTIENGGRGLTRKASFDIKCYTLSQAEIVTKHFYEPGFAVLVEFGWNTRDSINSKADLKQKGPCAIAAYNNYNTILSKRKKSNGTYDGFMGRITGGGYKNAENDTYIVSVELVSIGQVPAYLQVQKNGVLLNDKFSAISTDTGIKFKPEAIDTAAKNKNTYGRGLFMQMYNKLPLAKQTELVKNLVKDNQVDKRGRPWNDPGNYINIDDEIRKDIGSLAGSTIKLKTDTASNITITSDIPDGIELISEKHSFIRIELAFAILNTYNANLEPLPAKNCSEVTTYSYKINTRDTVIRAHSHIFSTDLSKLYIPNSKLPEFGLVNAITSHKLIDKWPIDVDRIENNVSGSVVNGNMFEDDSNNDYAFPQTHDSLPKFLKETQTSVTYKAENYGYLDDLYINFDFFINVISRSNYVAKDIYYELLNGISSAANSYWEFEIYENANNPIKFGKKSKSKSTLPNYQLEIKDTTFLGNIDKTKLKIPEFQSKGIGCPFLSSDLNMDIPAIMQNTILGQRSSLKVETQAEGQPLPRSFFFSKTQDRVVAILNSFKSVNNATVEPSPTSSKKLSQDQIKKQNLELYMKKAIIIPKHQFRSRADIRNGWFDWLSSSNKTTVENFFLVGGWSDSSLLTTIRLRDEGKLSIANGSHSISNPAILSIEFNFEIHGISGLKIGDLFRIIDLPSVFKSGTFQIMEVSHDISDNLWKTTVKATMRNIKI